MLWAQSTTKDCIRATVPRDVLWKGNSTKRPPLRSHYNRSSVKTSLNVLRKECIPKRLPWRRRNKTSSVKERHKTSCVKETSQNVFRHGYTTMKTFLFRPLGTFISKATIQNIIFYFAGHGAEPFNGLAVRFLTAVKYRLPFVGCTRPVPRNIRIKRSHLRKILRKVVPQNIWTKGPP